MKILLATWNKEKVRWLSDGFSSLSLPIVTLDKNKFDDVEESGITCDENALIKVNAIGTLENTIIIGEDSVLSIDALNGFPGVKTVRWMHGTDDDRAEKLLEMMTEIPGEERSARFLSSIAILFPDNSVKICNGEMNGNIATKPIGEIGKGYKQIFVKENGNTIAESGSGPIQDNDHRDQAIRKACKKIKDWLQEVEK